LNAWIVIENVFLVKRAKNKMNKKMTTKKEKDKLLLSFLSACETGNLDHAQALWSNFSICLNDRYEIPSWVSPNEVYDLVKSSFQRAREGGHINIVNWIVRVCENYVFRNACAEGNLDLAKWTHSIANFTKNDACAHLNHAFLFACENGHFDVVKWLHETFNLALDDVSCCNNYAFRMALSNGHIELFNWLLKTFNTTNCFDSNQSNK
jgi:hypothetical protein